MKKNKNKMILFIAMIFLFLLPIVSFAQDPKLVFQSGFEGTTEVVEEGGNDFGAPYEKLTGYDNTFTEKSNWDADWTNGRMQVQYTGGDATKRFAKVVEDPTQASNKVLHFWLNDSWTADAGAQKARIQTNLYGINPGYKEFYQSVRVYLTEDFRALTTYPSAVKWCTLSEFWNNEWWDNKPNGFRISLGVGKPSAAVSDLSFLLSAENSGQVLVWNADNTYLKVPIGKWFTMEYYYKEGNKDTGRFWMAITPDGEATKVVFDVHDFTHNTADSSPDGVTGFNPLKLYTGDYILNHVKAQGKTLQIYWDDYKFWKDKAPTIDLPVSNCGSVVPWTNYSIPTQTSIFTYEFDVIPGGNYMNGVVGLSNGAVTGYSSLGCIVQFNADGTIKARDGGVYVATNVLPYIEAATYHVKMDVNIITHKYDVFITPLGLPTVQIATNFSFRSEQATVSQLNNLSIKTETCSLILKNYLSTPSFETDNSLMIYPNPLDHSQEFIIKLDSEIQKATIQIYDIAGRLVQEIKTENISNLKVKLNSDLKSGIYIVNVLDGKKAYHQKIIIE